jgi:hypothetical protein
LLEKWAKLAEIAADARQATGASLKKRRYCHTIAAVFFGAIRKMKRSVGTLIALAAIAAKVGLPLAAVAQEVDELTEQCEYIWDIRDDRTALQRELDLLLRGSSEALSCRFDTPPELRDTCEEQCVGLIVALLGDSPIAQLPGPVDPY